jgi:uncharacterized protein YigA (DUF484 family)
MSIQQKPGHIDERITEKDVEQYLQQHPDFFEGNPALLTELSIPHNTGAAVSLVERQVQVLRKQNKKLSRQLEELVKIARENDKLGKQVFHLTLALMSAKDLGRVFALLYESLRRDFNVDTVALRLLASPKQREYNERIEFAGTDQLQRLFGKYLKEGRPVCGRVKGEQKDFLFGDDAERVKSLVLLPLSAGASFGLLAIGSEDESRFQAGMGTLYLNQMSAIIGKVLLNFLQPL